MQLKCYHHLHHVENYDVCVTGHKAYEVNRVHIFEMIVSTSELVTDLVNKEFLIFRRFQVDPTKIKCSLQWWQKHESMFPNVDFLAQQILGIIESQIETKKIFSLVSIFTNLRRCHL
jgi:hypothetical protein